MKELIVIEYIISNEKAAKMMYKLTRRQHKAQRFYFKFTEYTSLLKASIARPDLKDYESGGDNEFIRSNPYEYRSKAGGVLTVLREIPVK